MQQIPSNLHRWIQHKLDTYTEKPRKGVPKGQSYGIPKKKYHAALLNLARSKALDLRAIAQRAGVSYSLLLNWRTEDRFQKLIQRATAEYAQVVGRDMIYGESVDPDIGAYERFVEEELLEYSSELFLAILQDLGQTQSECEGVSQSARTSDLRLWKRLTRISIFMFVFMTEVIEFSSASKSTKMKLLAKQEERLLSHLDETARILHSGSNRPARQEFQREGFRMALSLARQGIKRIVSLKKQLIEQEIDLGLSDDA
ncbi:hypothetical protein E3J48_04550 [Candidatus Aerophobetes bacterium]|uniref:Uncharacterized protein n=1 Tax=Aerophobetes bacterium TaxID=2030807 RepID=A0A523W5F1_UNCAE|nr:MAG: hypothetical protein E3J48_04550 [Candidatus Aerophobetes bacterium]